MAVSLARSLAAPPGESSASHFHFPRGSEPGRRPIATQAPPAGDPSFPGAPSFWFSLRLGETWDGEGAAATRSLGREKRQGERRRKEQNLAESSLYPSTLVCTGDGLSSVGAQGSPATGVEGQKTTRPFFAECTPSVARELGGLQTTSSPERGGRVETKLIFGIGVDGLSNSVKKYLCGLELSRCKQFDGFWSGLGLFPLSPPSLNPDPSITTLEPLTASAPTREDQTNSSREVRAGSPFRRRPRCMLPADRRVGCDLFLLLPSLLAKISVGLDWPIPDVGMDGVGGLPLDGSVVTAAAPSLREERSGANSSSRARPPQLCVCVCGDQLSGASTAAASSCFSPMREAKQLSIASAL